MDRWKSICRAVSLVVGLMLMAQSVCAQTSGPAQPYRSLFGSTDTNRPSLHALDLTVSFNGAADNGLASPSSANNPPQPSFQQLYSAGSQLNYALHGRQIAADVGGSGNLPYYPGSRDQLSTLGYGANAVLSFKSGATSATTYGSYAYSPYYSMALDPAVAPGPSAQPFDYASERNPNEQTSAGASLTHRFGRRTSALLAYGFNNLSFVTGDRSGSSLNARISTDRPLSRSLTLRGSYAYRQGVFATAATPSTNRSHDLDLGLGYSRSLPRGQAVSMDLSVGTSIVSDGLAGRPIWRGSAQASRTLGGGWTARAGFSRTVQFESVVQQPIVADVANADLSGRFGRKVTLSLDGTYSSGQDVAQRSERFNIYSSSARVQIGLTSFAAINAQYIYYRYDFPPRYQLPGGVPVRMNRQRLQIGASFWLPLVRAGSAR